MTQLFQKFPLIYFNHRIVIITLFYGSHSLSKQKVVKCNNKDDQRKKTMACFLSCMCGAIRKTWICFLGDNKSY